VLVPGVSAGPIRGDTDEKTVKFLFPDATPCEVDVGEGQTEQGTCIGKGTPDSAELLWADEEHNHPRILMVHGSAWRTAEGIGLGSTAPELEAVLGPFEVAGFDWDGGGVVSFEKSRKAAEWHSKIWMYMEPPPYDHPGWKTAKVPAGDNFGPASDMRSLELKVGRMHMEL
jgi:hypothetical protein